MPEAERVLPRQLRLVGPDELLAHERRQPGDHLRLVRSERLHRPAVEDAALDGTSLEHAPLRRVELVETRGEQRLDRRRNGHVPAWRFPDHRDHLLDEQRIPLRRLANPLTQSPSRCARLSISLIGLGRAERLEQDVGGVHLPAGPARPPIEQVRPGHAEQENRRVP